MMNNHIVEQKQSYLPAVSTVNYASDDDIKKTLDARWSSNTHRSYASQWKEFTKWCEKYGHISLPATPETVARYLISMSVDGKRMPTLRSASSAIAAAHKGLKYENPCSNEIVRAAIAGRNRIDKRVAKQKKPIDDSIMDDVLRSLWMPRKKNWGRKENMEEAKARASVDEALIRLMQCCALRRSEVAELEWNDYYEENDGSARLIIRQSKTDQTGEGYIAYVNRRTARAINAIKPDNIDGKIFDMTPETVNNRIKFAIKEAGYNPKEYGGHSGRVGFAVMLTQKQAPTSEVMRMGRWSSPSMVAKYTRGIEAAASARWLE